MPGRGALNRSVHFLGNSSLRARAIASGEAISDTILGIASSGKASRNDGWWSFWGGWEGAGSYAKITIMKATIPQPVHESYLKHRKQIVWQVILPVVLASLLIVALIVLINIATFNQGGDVARWAAVSTIWIVIPIMIGMMIFLALLTGLVYLMKKLLNITPTYTGMAQDYVHIAAGYIKRAADAVVRPIFILDGIGASIKAFLGRK